MHTSVRLHPDKFSLRIFGMNAGGAGLLLAILLVGCTKQEIPELGPRLSQTAALELSPSLLESKAEYADNCGHLQIVELGSTLQDTLFEAANKRRAAYTSSIAASSVMPARMTPSAALTSPGLGF